MWSTWPYISSYLPKERQTVKCWMYPKDDAQRQSLFVRIVIFFENHPELLCSGVGITIRTHFSEQKNVRIDLAETFRDWARVGKIAFGYSHHPGKNRNFEKIARAFSHRLNMGKIFKSPLLEIPTLDFENILICCTPCPHPSRGIGHSPLKTPARAPRAGKDFRLTSTGPGQYLDGWPFVNPANASAWCTNDESQTKNSGTTGVEVSSAMQNRCRTVIQESWVRIPERP